MSVTSACLNAIHEGKKVIFFGAGASAKLTLTRLQNKQTQLVSYICDNNRHGGDILGVPIYHCGKLLSENKDETVIIVTSIDFWREITKQLFDMGFYNVYTEYSDNANRKITEADIITPAGYFSDSDHYFNRYDVLSRMDTGKVRGMLADELSAATFDKLLEAYRQNLSDFSHVNTKDTQYFNDIFQKCLTDDEVYVDVGVCYISSIVEFIFYTGGNYKKIYGFEPDITTYIPLIRELADVRDLELFHCGLSDSDGQLSFDARGFMGTSRAVEDETNITGVLTKINVVKLDGFLQEPPTLIKMDIEGAEYDALIGARETICKYKPKLAISAYHKNDDLVTLPLLLHEMVPEYKLYLRHHTDRRNETVLYAKV